ncbi:hypothetical protein DFH29DRAFT_34515 [Suillus ampliporus]|nr:hypothetical protein DFH29DRAFT_34515 [Suillus ampliporus]
MPQIIHLTDCYIIRVLLCLFFIRLLFAIVRSKHPLHESYCSSISFLNLAECIPCVQHTIVDLVVVQIYHTLPLIRFFIPVLTYNYSYPSLKCDETPGKALILSST